MSAKRQWIWRNPDERSLNQTDCALTDAAIMTGSYRRLLGSTNQVNIAEEKAVLAPQKALFNCAFDPKLFRTHTSSTELRLDPLKDVH
ncbi:unnamed protein product [Toxocara canis]|uniref:Uncharacterized protein n=1 Tax=Toxocara canis TaxID=6265 RepID=A0A183V953_TOXCA|nr:unnamed protein product [Toxocara canis]